MPKQAIAALLAGDTLFGVPDLPILVPTYRVHSLEILAGAIARLSPLSAIQVAHVLLPFLFGLLTPLAIARLDHQ